MLEQIAESRWDEWKFIHRGIPVASVAVILVFCILNLGIEPACSRVLGESDVVLLSAILLMSSAGELRQLAALGRLRTLPATTPSQFEKLIERRAARNLLLGIAILLLFGLVKGSDIIEPHAMNLTASGGVGVPMLPSGSMANANMNDQINQPEPAATIPTIPIVSEVRWNQVALNFFLLAFSMGIGSVALRSTMLQFVKGER